MYLLLCPALGLSTHSTQIFESKSDSLPCLFIACGKCTRRVWKAIYHSLALSASHSLPLLQSKLVLSHSLWSLKWAVSSPLFSSDVLIACPDILRPQSRVSVPSGFIHRRQSKAEATEIGPQWTSCYWCPAVLKTTSTASGRQRQLKQTGAVWTSSVWHEN